MYEVLATAAISMQSVCSISIQNKRLAVNNCRNTFTVLLLMGLGFLAHRLIATYLNRHYCPELLQEESGREMTSIS